MKLYVLKINEQGSLVASETKPTVSRLGITRTPGQRYQVPSIIRAAEQTNNGEVVDAARSLIEDLHDQIEKDGFAEIDWAVKTDNPFIALIDGERIETRRKWADFDMDALDTALEAYIPEEQEEKPRGNGNGTRGG
jgi:hypothetical protein